MSRAFDTLAEWLSWLETSHPVEIDMGLDRCRSVWLALEQNLSRSKVISIAGTNGKGSTLAMLDSIYRAAGYSTLCYTSPHLHVFNERIVINGELSTDEQLTGAFSAIITVADSLDISLTYFEVSTLAALYIAAQVQPDVLLLEVGLGGRLDAVNIIDADLAVVTTIGIDHVDWLGDDAEAIGYEKSGIFRADKVAVCGDLDPPKSIQSYAAKIGAPLWQAQHDFSYHIQQDNQRFNWQGKLADHTIIELKDLHIPQLPLQNAATALQALHLLGLHCDFAAIQNGLANAKVAGRMSQIEYNGQQYLLDVAHNPQSAEYLAQTLRAKGLSGQVHLILGMLADKDIEAVIAELKPLATHWSLVSLNVPRGETAQALSQYVAKAGVPEQQIRCFDSVAAAITQTQAVRSPITLIAGSFYTVAAGFDCLDQDH